MSKVLPKRVTLLVGQTIMIHCVNPRNFGEYSTYRVVITDDDVRGDGLEDVFLAETTGCELND